VLVLADQAISYLKGDDEKGLDFIQALYIISHGIGRIE
jgi:hypothetical protein